MIVYVRLSEVLVSIDQTTWHYVKEYYSLKASSTLYIDALHIFHSSAGLESQKPLPCSVQEMFCPRVWTWPQIYDTSRTLCSCRLPSPSGAVQIAESGQKGELVRRGQLVGCQTCKFDRLHRDWSITLRRRIMLESPPPFQLITKCPANVHYSVHETLPLDPIPSWLHQGQIYKIYSFNI
jgi:hypothetical protein